MRNDPAAEAAASGTQPRVSIIIATYNRASTLMRAIDGALAQDMTDLEVVIVDDGSTDATRELLDRIEDPRVRAVRHESNRGVAAAKNTGMDHMRGEWFTFLDSDDEVAPNAMSVMLAVPDRIDQSIDAVSCNCVDAVTGRFSGTGLDHDQWLDARTALAVCEGEFWGITKTSLVGAMRFNERIPHVSGLWERINEVARRYYIHRALRVYHTEAEGRVCEDLGRKGFWSERRVEGAAALLDEEQDYLALVRRYNPEKYVNLLFMCACSLLASRDRSRAARAIRQISAVERRWRLALLVFAYWTGPWSLRLAYAARAGFSRVRRIRLDFLVAPGRAR